MPTYTRPGVYVTETSLPNTTTTGLGESLAIFVGEHFWGPTTPVFCSSWGAFVKTFGGFPPFPANLGNPYLAYSVYEFFANGGNGAWVLRVVGTGGANALHTFDDTAATPLPTLELQALSQGSYGNNLYADIVVPSTGAGSFTLNIYLNGTNPTNLVESWPNLTMNASSPNYALAVPTPQRGGSQYVTAINENSTTAPPNNNPGAVTGVQFSGGVDGGDPTAAQYTAVLTYGSSPLDGLQGMFLLALPGNTVATVENAAISYAAARSGGSSKIFVVADGPQTPTPSSAVSTLTAYAASLAPQDNNVGVYGPWVNASNPAASVVNQTLLMPPSPFVMGQIIQNDLANGVWSAPAGLSTALANVVSLQYTPTDNDLGTLNAANVNALRSLGGFGQAQGVVIWGARTLYATDYTQYINVRRTLDYIEASIVASSQWVPFQSNDSALWTLLATDIGAFLNEIFQAGGLAGSSPSQAYFVVCDDTINTPATISQGVVNVQVGVAVAVPAEFVVFQIGLWQGGTTTVTSVAA